MLRAMLGVGGITRKGGSGGKIGGRGKTGHRLVLRLGVDVLVLLPVWFTCGMEGTLYEEKGGEREEVVGKRRGQKAAQV